MKLRYLILFFAIFTCLCIFSQKHMKFMGIPINGNVSAFCEKLKGMGYVNDKGSVANAYCFVGTFFGAGVIVRG